ncbi:MAG: DNA mismatch repair protein MutS, partial [bacterium]
MKQTEKAGGATGTPMMKQYLAIKRDHPDAILFFRMGDFYEMFMDDAVVAADVLKIALTTRDKGKKNAIPMCGIPYHAAEGYLTRLVRAGHKVAICEQVEDPAKARGLVRREVTRVVTPGTAVEDSLLQGSEPSYLAAVLPSGKAYGLALVDASTGEFLVAHLDGAAPDSRLQSTLAQYDPREILLPEGADGRGLPGHVAFLEPYRFNGDMARECLKEFFEVSTLSGFGSALEGPALGAAGAALWYLREVHGGALGHLRPARTLTDDEVLVLDANALRNLEVLKSLPEGKREGSLLGVMDRTVTSPGARLLREMLTRPLRRVPVIEERHELVGEFVQETVLRGRLREALRRVSDIDRIVARFTTGNVGPRDAKALAQTLEELPAIRELLSELNSDLGEQICRGVDVMGELAQLLHSCLVDNPPGTLRDGGVFREGYHPDLDDLRAMARDGRKYLSGLENRERSSTGIGSLKVGFNKVFGYYLEVTNAHKELVPPEWIRKQTLVNAERYITEELKGLEDRILSAQERMVLLERELFEELRRSVLEHTRRLQETASNLAMADVFSALAELAHSSGYVRPHLLENDPVGRISITGGRH